MSELADLIQNAPTQEWLRDAACAEMDLDDFFVDAGHTIVQKNLNVCRGCPVREACLRHAYAHGLVGGYFGGMSTGQRKDMTLEEALEFIKNDPVQVIVETPRRRRR